MKIKIVYILLFLSLSFYACNEKNANKEESKESIESNEAAITDNGINLDALQNSPNFNNEEADKFVLKAKKYLEDVVTANKNGDNDKVMELQLQSEEIHTEYQNIKSKLKPEQQTKLESWYNQLVEAASK